MQQQLIEIDLITTIDQDQDRETVEIIETVETVANKKDELEIASLASEIAYVQNRSNLRNPSRL